MKFFLEVVLCLQITHVKSYLIYLPTSLPIPHIYSNPNSFLDHYGGGEWWFSDLVVSDSCDHMYCSPPDSSVHGVLQARILEWVVISFSREFSLTQVLNPHLLPLQADSLPNEPPFFTEWSRETLDHHDPSLTCLLASPYTSLPRQQQERSF